MQLVALALTLAQAGSAGPAASNQPSGPGGPRVALEVTQGRTALGTIVIELDPAKAPLSVENFLSYLRAGHYDGTTFHRVIPAFMIQGGGYTPELEEKPTRPPVPNEARNGVRNSRGTVAMARTDDANSATSQFFINLRDNHRLDFGISGAGYAVFGRVVEGLEIVDRISGVPTTTRGQHSNVPQTSVVVRRARELPPAAPATPAQPPAQQPPPQQPPAP